MAKTYISTPADDSLRREVALTILRGLSEDSEFGEPKEFSKWQRDHKITLVSLFGGRGIVNLARVVAWIRREALQIRHSPPELLCLVYEGLSSGTLPDPIVEALDGLLIGSVTELLLAVMTDVELSKSLMKSAPINGLDDLF